MLYSTADEAIELEIIEALGDYVADFDIPAIADAVIEPVVRYNKDGVQLGNVQYRIRDDVDFWAIAFAHVKDGEQ